MKWENVSVFISSTFQDMHGERDYLVKEVFPELLAWCESRRLHMYDIDLRWGITREDSTSHNTVAACLHNIDKCRPFFICFLGQRRGWVPGSEDVSSGTSEEYPALPEYLGRTSVTEMEIEHALPGALVLHDDIVGEFLGCIPVFDALSHIDGDDGIAL